MERDHMAEENQTQELVIANASGTITETRPISTPRESLAQHEPSEFEKLIGGENGYLKVRENYKHFRSLYELHKINPDRLPASVNRDTLASDLENSRNRLIELKGDLSELIAEADELEILSVIRNKIAQDYRALMGSNFSPSERPDRIGDPRYGLFTRIDWEKGDPQRGGRSLWDDPYFRDFEARFRGLPQFIYEEIIDAIERDVERERSSFLNSEEAARLVEKKDPRVTLEPNVLIEDEEFINIKIQREIERKLNLRAELTPQLHTTFFRIEDENDLFILVPKRINYVEKITSDEVVASQYQSIEKGRGELAELINRAIDLFNQEYNLDLEPDDAVVKRMKSLVETRLNSFGGARCVNRGGFEHYSHFRENDANNYVAHLEAMYTEDQNMPLALHFVSHGINYENPDDFEFNNNGEYWRGCPSEVDRPTDGQIEAYQRRHRDIAVTYLATHELKLKAHVEKRIRDERKQLALLSRGQRKDREEEIFSEERDKFLAEHSVFIRTKERWDRRNAQAADERVKKGEISQFIADKLKQLVDTDGNLVSDEIRKGIVRDIIWSEIAKVFTIDPNTQVEKINDILMAGFTKDIKVRWEKAANSDPDDRDKKLLIAEVQRSSVSKDEKISLIVNINKGELTVDQRYFLIDRLAWKWVEKRNDVHVDQGWYPTSWDEIRYLIDHPEKVLRRAMSAEELFAMYQPVDFSHLTDKNGNPDQKKIEKELERRGIEADQSFQTAITYLVYEGVSSRDGGTRIEVLIDDPNGDIDDPEKEIDPATGQIKKKKLIYSPVFAEMWSMFDKVPRVDFKDTVTYPRPKKLPKDATEAQHTEKDTNGKTYDENMIKWYQDQQEVFFKKHRNLRNRYKDALHGKINENGKRRPITEAEKKQLEQELRKLRDTEGACIDILAVDGKRRWIFFNGKFVVRDILKEFGISGKLPVWSSYLVSSDVPLKEFSDLLGIHPKKKTELGMILEGERRILTDITDQLTEAFMMDPSDDRDVIVKAIRDNWKGGNIDIRKIFNARMYYSTTGGVVARGLIPIMDLGVSDMWQEVSGAQDAREHVSFVFREDELESRNVPLYDVLDPVDYNKRLAGAEELRKIVGGGRVGDKNLAGFLNEVFEGAYKMRDIFKNQYDIFEDIVKDQKKYKWTYEDFDVLLNNHKRRIDRFIEYAQPVIKPLMEFLSARRILENRYVRASDQFIYDNTKIWYWFRNWLRYSPEFRKPPFNYANQARTELAIRVYELVLEANMLILPPEKREELFPEEWGKNKVNRWYDYDQNMIYEDDVAIA